MTKSENKPDLSHLPSSSGVYLHKNSDGEVIYVGKAVNLKSRVNQYWQKSSQQASAKTAALAAESVKVDYLETLSEIDALFLEAELIKRYMPKFNILLRDDKSATYVRIPYKDLVPVLSFTREPKDDGASYIGPFYNSSAVYAAMRILRKVIPYVSHRKIPKKACLQYQLGLCPGPEVEGFDSKKYRGDLKKLEAVLKGERQTVLRDLEKEMSGAANNQDFEVAARLRNKIGALKRVGSIKLKDEEVFGTDQALDGLKNLLGLGEIPKHIEGFDISHMGGKEVVASQVVFRSGVSSRTDYRNYKLKVQQNDDYASMAEIMRRRLSEKNIAAWGAPDLILIDGGKGQLASAESAMNETGWGGRIPTFGLAKRFEEVVVQKNSKLIKLNFKYAARTNRVVRDEGEFWVISFGQKDPVRLLLQRIRDEAHRFAVRYHTKLKTSKVKLSELSMIPGIGSSTAQKLMITFGSVAGVKAASHAQLASLVGNLKAKNIERYFAGAPDSGRGDG